MNRFTNFLADHNLAVLLVAGSAIVASCVPIEAEAKCLANDAWRGPDKTLHAQVGAAVGFVGALNNGSALEGAKWAALVGGAKEALDATGSGTCSLQDFLVTVAGGALGAGLGKGLYLTLDPRAKAVQLTYSMELK